MPTTINLGFEVPDYSSGIGSSTPIGSKEMPTKTAYPSMTIPGNKALARALKPGQKITALVTFCVAEVAIRDRKSDNDDAPVDQYSGTRVELEAESMQFDNLKVSDEEEETDGASAFKNYMKKKKPASDEGDAFGGGEG